MEVKQVDTVGEQGMLLLIVGKLHSVKKREKDGEVTLWLDIFLPGTRYTVRVEDSGLYSSLKSAEGKVVQISGEYDRYEHPRFGVQDTFTARSLHYKK